MIGRTGISMFEVGTLKDVGGLWAGVRERVEVLAGLLGATKVFGASDHGFALAAPLTEEQLYGWEATVGVTLPIPYRSFPDRGGCRRGRPVLRSARLRGD